MLRYFRFNVAEMHPFLGVVKDMDTEVPPIFDPWLKDTQA